MKRLILTLPILLMTACVPSPTSVSSVPSQEVYRIQGYYAAARVVENAYYDLPRCGKPTSPKLCSDVEVLRKVRKADNAAYAAIIKADDTVNRPGFGASQISAAIAVAEAAVNAFVSLTTNLKVK